ncbi:hypothetical protein BC332_15701 [Capsicum chinense]|nr:hypothetical protein BC332_15701 [Capsicum chinense]
MMKLFDSHCHLQDPRIINMVLKIIKTTIETGVVHFAVNDILEKDWHLVKEMSELYPFGEISLDKDLFGRKIDFADQVSYIHEGKQAKKMLKSIPKDRILLEIDGPNALPKLSNPDSLNLIKKETIFVDGISSGGINDGNPYEKSSEEDKGNEQLKGSTKPIPRYREENGSNTTNLTFAPRVSRSNMTRRATTIRLVVSTS